MSEYTATASPAETKLGLIGSTASPAETKLGLIGSTASPAETKLGLIGSTASPAETKLGLIGSTASGLIGRTVEVAPAETRREKQLKRMRAKLEAKQLVKRINTTPPVKKKDYVLCVPAGLTQSLLETPGTFPEGSIAIEKKEFNRQMCDSICSAADRYNNIMASERMQDLFTEMPVLRCFVKRNTCTYTSMQISHIPNIVFIAAPTIDKFVCEYEVFVFRRAYGVTEELLNMVDYFVRACACGNLEYGLHSACTCPARSCSFCKEPGTMQHNCPGCRADVMAALLAYPEAHIVAYMFCSGVNVTLIEYLHYTDIHTLICKYLVDTFDIPAVKQHYLNCVAFNMHEYARCKNITHQMTNNMINPSREIISIKTHEDRVIYHHEELGALGIYNMMFGNNMGFKLNTKLGMRVAYNPFNLPPDKNADGIDLS